MLANVSLTDQMQGKGRSQGSDDRNPESVSIGKDLRLVPDRPTNYIGTDKLL
jgi:hypothetical protein